MAQRQVSTLARLKCDGWSVTTAVLSPPQFQFQGRLWGRKLHDERADSDRVQQPALNFGQAVWPLMNENCQRQKHLLTNAPTYARGRTHGKAFLGLYQLWSA